MTTIAWDGNEIAADSLVTAGSFKHQTPYEKIKTIGCLLVATRGDVDSGEFFHQWIEKNWTAKGWDVELSEEFEAMVVDLTSGKCYVYESRLYPYEVKPPFAIGSGFKYAMGAMLAGATATQAVEISTRLDKNSGPPIQTIKIGSSRDESGSVQCET